jgi:hypothetical protein
VSIPSFARKRAAVEPAGPPPITRTLVLSIIYYTAGLGFGGWGLVKNEPIPNVYSLITF